MKNNASNLIGSTSFSFEPSKKSSKTGKEGTDGTFGNSTGTSQLIGSNLQRSNSIEDFFQIKVRLSHLAYNENELKLRVTASQTTRQLRQQIADAADVDPTRLRMFFGGKLKSMPPKLVSDDGRHVVIRPLAYVKEADLAAYADWREFPIIPCTLCGSQANLKRQEVKLLMREWEKRFPGRVENIFSSLTRVTPSHLLDRALHDFASIEPTGQPEPDGDVGFDPDPLVEAPSSGQTVIEFPALRRIEQD